MGATSSCCLPSSAIFCQAHRCAHAPHPWELQACFKPVSLQRRLAAACPLERAFGLELLAARRRSSGFGADCNLVPPSSQVDAAIYLLEDPFWEVRNAAAKALSSLGRIVAAEHVTAVRRLAEDHEDPALRLLASAVLRHIGSGLPYVVPFPIDKHGGAPGEQMTKVVDVKTCAIQVHCSSSSSSRELVLAAVDRAGESLRYADPEFQADRQVVAAAVRQNGEALRYASEELRADPKVVAEAVAAAGPSALRHVAQPIRDRMYIDSELAGYSHLLEQWQRTEEAVYGYAPRCDKMAAAIAAVYDEKQAGDYLMRRASLVNLMRDLAGDLDNLAMWPRAVILLDAFYNCRDQVELQGRPAAQTVAAAAVLILMKAEQRRFVKTRWQDAKTAVAARLGMQDNLAASTESLLHAERCLFRMLGGRVMLASVPQWSAIIFDRLELVANEKLRKTLRNQRQEAMQTAELVTVRVMASAAFPPRVLARGACVAALIHSGLLPAEDDWGVPDSSEAVTAPTRAYENRPADVECLDLSTLAWAVGCDVDQLCADARVTLSTAGPMIAPAA